MKEGGSRSGRSARDIFNLFSGGRPGRDDRTSDMVHPIRVGAEHGREEEAGGGARASKIRGLSILV